MILKISEVFSYVSKNIDESDMGIQYIKKIQRLCEGLMNNHSECYQLKTSDKNKISRFSVYSFFISFLILNTDKQEVTLIEFGQD